jgi:putative NADH-flavin reductase
VKLLVFGATGKTGQLLVRHARERGHDVTAFVRDPAKLAGLGDTVRIARGQVTEDTAAVEDAVAGQDAVLVALGPRSPFDDAVMTASLGLIVPAMTAHGVRRLVLLSALGLGDGVEKAPLPMTVVGRSLLRRPAADKRASERLVRGADLDWLSLYPGALTGGDGTGTYRLIPAGRVRGFPRIARADVAKCMLDEVEHPTLHKAAAVLVASR